MVSQPQPVLAGTLEPLTKAQRRVYAEVLKDGRRVYNGRLRATVETLVKLELVRACYELMESANGRTRTRITVRRLPARQLIARPR